MYLETTSVLGDSRPIFTTHALVCWLLLLLHVAAVACCCCSLPLLLFASVVSCWGYFLLFSPLNLNNVNKVHAVAIRAMQLGLKKTDCGIADSKIFEWNLLYWGQCFSWQKTWVSTSVHITNVHQRRSKSNGVSMLQTKQLGGGGQNLTSIYFQLLGWRGRRGLWTLQHPNN